MKADSHRFSPKIGEFCTVEMCVFELFVGCEIEFELLSVLNNGEAPLKVVKMLSFDSLLDIKSESGPLSFFSRLTNQIQPHPIIAEA